MRKENIILGRKRKQRDSFRRNKVCCLCGGSEVAATVEHAPPRVLFVGKQRPKGFEVPACKRCNNGSSHSDQVAALHCYMQAAPLFRNGFEDSKTMAMLLKVHQGVANNNKDLKGAFTPAGTEFWRFEGKQERFQKIRIDGRVFDTYLDPWAAKQVYAHWYSITGRVVSPNGHIFVRWTNLRELTLKPELLAWVERFADLSRLTQGKLDTTEQWFLKHAFNKEEGVGLMFSSYHGGASFLAAISDNPNAKVDRFAADSRSFVCYQTNQKSGIHCISG